MGHREDEEVHIKYKVERQKGSSGCVLIYSSLSEMWCNELNQKYSYGTCCQVRHTERGVMHSIALEEGHRI